MADLNAVYTANSLIHTGTGILTGVIISTTGAGGVTATFYDNTAGSGTKLLEVNVSNQSPAVVFFSDRYALRFSTGLYVTLGAAMAATVWAITL